MQAMTDSDDRDWKLKLRYGQLQTTFSHFTVLADGVAGDLKDGFECRRGPAIMAMKTWAESVDQSADMIRAIGRQVGFAVTGDVQVYETEPESPPRATPHGYDIRFTPFDADQT
jgi:hypothetical protein